MALICDTYLQLLLKIIKTCLDYFENTTLELYTILII